MEFTTATRKPKLWVRLLRKLNAVKIILTHENYFLFGYVNEYAHIKPICNGSYGYVTSDRIDLVAQLIKDNADVYANLLRNDTVGIYYEWENGKRKILMEKDAREATN